MCENLQRSHRHSGYNEMSYHLLWRHGEYIELKHKIWAEKLSLNLWRNLLNCRSQLLCSLTGISLFLLLSLSTYTSKVSDQKFPWVWFCIVVYPHPEEKQTVSIYVASNTSHTSNISMYRLEIDFFFFKEEERNPASQQKTF